MPVKHGTQLAIYVMHRRRSRSFLMNNRENQDLLDIRAALNDEYQDDHFYDINASYMSWVSSMKGVMRLREL